MKCPLMIIGRMLSSDPSDISYTDCSKGGCAWWDEADERCFVRTLPFELNRIGSAVQAIASKIPPGILR